MEQERTTYTFKVNGEQVQCHEATSLLRFYVMIYV